jgi:RimJ/RimL family protein N-acetyltransferase
MKSVLPVVLENSWTRLEPSHIGHAADLSLVATPETFRYFVTDFVNTCDEADLRAYIERVVQAPATVSYTVIDVTTNRAVGMTSYMDIRAENHGLEIGRTWYGEAYRGTKINPSAKLLLLEHAFESLDAVRVQLKSDARNTLSRNAMLKLGAQFEGALRKHLVMPDGYIRDTAMYSIIAEEWPAVKAKLLARLHS